MQIKTLMEYPTQKDLDTEVHDPLEAYYSGYYTYEDYLKFEFEEMVELIRANYLEWARSPAKPSGYWRQSLSVDCQLFCP